jgi:ankyrin repeat protein
MEKHLYEYIARNELQQVKKVIEKFPNMVNEPAPDRSSMVCKNKDRVQRQYDLGDYPLFIAIKFGLEEIIHLLLKCGANPNLMGQKGKNRSINCVAYACLLGQPNILEIMIKESLVPIDLNCKVSIYLEDDGEPWTFNNITPLGLACFKKRIPLVRWLIERKEVIVDDSFGYVRKKITGEIRNAIVEDWPMISSLILGLIYGSIPIVKLLLSAKANANQWVKTPEGQVITPLTSLIYSNFITNEDSRKVLAELLIAHGADIHTEMVGITPMIAAVRHRRTEIIKLFLKQKVSLDQPLASGSLKGATPLELACSMFNADIVKLLLMHGANANRIMKEATNTQNPNKITWVVTPLFVIIEMKPSQECLKESEAQRLEIIRQLLDYGADPYFIVKQPREEQGRSALIVAIEENNFTVVKLLVEHMQLNPQLNFPEMLAYAFFRAIILNAKKIALWLLDNFNIDLNAPIFADADPQDIGSLPLLLACEVGDVSIVKQLLERGAAVNGVPVSGVNAGTLPLVVASRHKNIELLELMFKDGADVRLANTGKNWPKHNILSVAVCCRSEALVTYILQKFPQILKSGELQGLSPLTCAILTAGSENLVEFLLQHGASATESHPIIPGESPLSIAVKSDKVAIASILLRYGADVNKTCQTSNSLYEGHSPIVIAILNERLPMVEVLLEHKADLWQVCQSGELKGLNAWQVSLLQMELRHKAAIFIQLIGDLLTSSQKANFRILIEKDRVATLMAAVIIGDVKFIDFCLSVFDEHKSMYINSPSLVEKHKGLSPLALAVITSRADILQCFSRCDEACNWQQIIHAKDRDVSGKTVFQLVMQYATDRSFKESLSLRLQPKIIANRKSENNALDKSTHKMNSPIILKSNTKLRSSVNMDLIDVIYYMASGLDKHYCLQYAARESKGFVQVLEEETNPVSNDKQPFLRDLLEGYLLNIFKSLAYYQHYNVSEDKLLPNRFRDHVTLLLQKHEFQVDLPTSVDAFYWCIRNVLMHSYYCLSFDFMHSLAEICQKTLIPAILELEQKAPKINFAYGSASDNNKNQLNVVDIELFDQGQKLGIAHYYHLLSHELTKIKNNLITLTGYTNYLSFLEKELRVIKTNLVHIGTIYQDLTRLNSLTELTEEEHHFLSACKEIRDKVGHSFNKDNLSLSDQIDPEYLFVIAGQGIVFIERFTELTWQYNDKLTILT